TSVKTTQPLIALYCGSRAGNNPIYREKAIELASGIAEQGFGFHIPKGYLYAAIGFSILVEMINQTMRRNQEKLVTTTDLR
ncbi:hypothetical protein, partial [Acinetobacter baumannii]|uniref:hypothetical protein n=1 Tax=Acinetobacter baumannii TaxID=470 RepID=UPI001CB7F8A1